MASSWAEAQTEGCFLLSGDSRDEEAGKELTTDGRPEAFGMGPRGPALRK